MTSLTACSSPFGRFPNVRGKTKEPGNKLDRLTAKYHRPKSIAVARLCLAQPFYAFTNNLKYFHKKCQHMRNAMTSQQPVRQTASQQANSVQSNPVQPQSQSQSQSLPLPAAAAARAGNQSQQPKSFQAKSSRRHRQQRRHRHGKASCRFHEICSKLLNTYSSRA